jgi:hypothetical protein
MHVHEEDLHGLFCSALLAQECVDCTLMLPLNLQEQQSACEVAGLPTQPTLAPLLAPLPLRALPPGTRIRAIEWVSACTLLALCTAAPDHALPSAPPPAAHPGAAGARNSATLRLSAELLVELRLTWPDHPPAEDAVASMRSRRSEQEHGEVGGSAVTVAIGGVLHLGGAGHGCLSVIRVIPLPFSAGGGGGGSEWRALLQLASGELRVCQAGKSTSKATADGGEGLVLTVLPADASFKEPCSWVAAAPPAPMLPTAVINHASAVIGRAVEVCPVRSPAVLEAATAVRRHKREPEVITAVCWREIRGRPITSGA